ncbi:MAG: glycosyltransferase [Thermoprotei archaeon]
MYQLPFACDPKIHRKLDTPKKYDTTFIGTFYFNRWQTLRKIRPKPHIFGPLWILKAGIHHPPLYGEDYVQVIGATKINLNIHHKADIASKTLNMRAFEVAGCGGFLITDNKYAAANILPAVFYDNTTDLLQKINYYLENEAEREEKANKLQEECYKKHTYQKRVDQLLTHIKGI